MVANERYGLTQAGEIALETEKYRKALLVAANFAMRGEVPELENCPCDGRKYPDEPTCVECFEKFFLAEAQNS